MNFKKQAFRVLEVILSPEKHNKMNNQTTFSAGKYWYLPLISGVLFILLSFWVFKTPVESYLALSIFFASLFMIGGLLEVFRALNNSGSKGWGWSLTFGIVDVIFGVLLLSNPSLSASALILYVGFILMFRSISSIGFATDLKDMGVKSWVGPLIFGILGLILAAIMIFNPAFGGFTIIFYTAMSLFFIGLFQILLAFSLKKLNALSK